MQATTDTPSRVWTAEELYERFGPIPLDRIRHDPPPGLATEADAIRINERKQGLCELVDGVLVEKTMGTYESYLTVVIAQFLGVFVRENRLGIVLGPDATTRLMPNLLRIPDVSFVSLDRLPGRKVPRTPVSDLSPDLAVEVISPGNTKKEMNEKLQDYFQSGVRLVWYVYPDPREVHIFRNLHQSNVLKEEGTLSGEDVLPGFELPLKTLFAEPTEPEEKR